MFWLSKRATLTFRLVTSFDNGAVKEAENSAGEMGRLSRETPGPENEQTLTFSQDSESAV